MFRHCRSERGERDRQADRDGQTDGEEGGGGEESETVGERVKEENKSEADCGNAEFTSAWLLLRLLLPRDVVCVV